MDHLKERFEPAWEKVNYIKRHIKSLQGLKNARFNYYPKGGEGIEYHIIGLHVTLVDSSISEANKIVRSMREDDPEVWVRYLGNSNEFIINCLNLKPGDERLIVERLTRLFS
jgi:hypothetical protein